MPYFAMRISLARSPMATQGAIVLPLVLGTYVFLAARARDLFTTPRAVRRLNRSSSVAMAGAAVIVATR